MLLPLIIISQRMLFYHYHPYGHHHKLSSSSTNILCYSSPHQHHCLGPQLQAYPIIILLLIRITFVILASKNRPTKSTSFGFVKEKHHHLVKKNKLVVAVVSSSWTVDIDWEPMLLVDLQRMREPLVKVTIIES